ncbi:MAG: hypothetical protein IPI67_25050 [Myxococcales bacterium]|nr:hypothetical protein [Myxococcales bacterium]
MRLLRCCSFLATVAALSAFACGADNQELVGAGASGGAGGVSGDAASGSGNSAGAGATAGAGGRSPDGGIATCQGHAYECGDLIDNDGDGRVDELDPDCLGPCDNTEGSYYGGIPGQNSAPCKMDCYFDQDTGQGNDDCQWNHECDPLAVAPSYPPEGLDKAQKPYCPYDPNATTPGSSATCSELFNTQSALCASYCGPLTPNGCDCFGCCELPAGGGKFVWLGSTVNGIGSCDKASLDDPEKCRPCTPVKACLNNCGACEFCVGKEELPAQCTADGGNPDAGDAGQPDGGDGTQCPTNVQACALAGQTPCSSGYYCITGCCRAVPK